MKETEALVRLQEIDLELMRHKRTLANMPQAKKLQAVIAARKKLAGEMSKLMGLRKDAQMDVDDNESSCARLKEIVEETQEKYTSGEVGYREVANLESQLTDLAKRIEKLEFKRKALDARLEKVTSAEKNAHTIDQRLQDEGAALVKSLKEGSANLEREMRELSAEREEVVSCISEDVLARYAEASKRFGGLAVETVRVNQPSVCRVTIPASSYGDIRRGPSITECPYCHRMLVTDGMFDVN